MDPRTEAREGIVLTQIVVSPALQQLDHVEKALHAGGVARALMHPPGHEHGISRVLIHLPLPGENRLGDVGETVPQEAAVCHMAQALGNSRRTDDVREQEDPGFLHRVVVPPREKTTDLPRVVELSYLKEAGHQKRRDDGEYEIPPKATFNSVISDAVEKLHLENDRTIDRVHGGQRCDYQQRVASDADNTELSEGHRSAPAGEDEFLAHADAGTDENADGDSPDSRKKERPPVELADDGTEYATDHDSPQSERGNRTEPLFHQVLHTPHPSPGAARLRSVRVPRCEHDGMPGCGSHARKRRKSRAIRRPFRPTVYVGNP